MKTARNTACPCGSGKKYKRCCGARSSLGFSREAASRARRKLAEFFAEEYGAGVLNEAFDAFWGQPQSLRELRESFELAELEVLETHFRDFLLLDRRDDQGRRPVERWFGLRGSKLSVGERAYIEALLRAPLGLYEVTRLEGPGVELLDLWLGGAPLRVPREQWLPRGARVGDTVAVRLLEVQGELRGSGSAALVFRISSSQELLSGLRQRYLEASGDGSVPSLQAFRRLFEPLLVERWIDDWRTCRRTAYPHTNMDLSQALDEQGGLRHLRSDDRRLVLYWGRIVHQASSLELDRPGTLSVHCRRRPESYPCEARLMAKRLAPEGDAGDELIEWWCPACEDSGTLRAWSGGSFDARVRAAGKSPRASVSLVLNTREWNLLNKPTCGLPAAALELLLSVSLTPAGGSLSGDPQAFEQLTAALETTVMAGSGGGGAAGARLHRKLSGAAGRRPYRTPECAATQPPLFDEAPTKSAAARRGPRPVVDESRPNLVLEVRLAYVVPAVQRSLLVPARATLEDLHSILQAALGWEDCHLHEFEVRGERYGLPDPQSPVSRRDSRAALLADCLGEEGDTLVYTYDFGDDWRHEVTLVSTVSGECSRAQLLSGTGACPPEDCGGPPGYQHLCEVLAHPDDPEFETLSEWIGGEFDPQRFERASHARRVAAAVEY